MKTIVAVAILHLSNLARIELNDREVKKMQREIGAILTYVEKLQAVDTNGTEPTSQVTGLKDVWRSDEPYATPWNREELLKNAPATQDGFIKVKRVL